MMAPTKPAAPKERTPYTDLVAALDSVGRERDWFAEGAIEGAPLAVFAGAEKKNKSWTLSQLAVATIVGGSFLGCFPIRKPGPFVLVDGEYGAHESVRRIARIARAEGHDPRAVLQHVRYFYGSLALDSDDDDFLAIARDVEKRPPAGIAFDPFRNFLRGDENSVRDVVEGMRKLGVIRDAGGCPLLLAHHLNRAGTMSGSRSLKTRADLFIEGDDTDEPRYTTIGRTIRRGDKIARPFSVVVEHTDDEDDTIARTFVRARFDGEQTARGALSRSALRMLDAVKSYPEGATSTALRKVTKQSSPVGNGALSELEKAGLVEKRGGVWKESSSAFLRDLNPPKEAADASDELPY